MIFGLLGLLGFLAHPRQFVSSLQSYSLFILAKGYNSLLSDTSPMVFSRTINFLDKYGLISPVSE